MNSNFLIPGKLYSLCPPGYDIMTWDRNGEKPRVISQRGDIMMFIGVDLYRGHFLLKDGNRGSFEKGSPMGLYPEHYFVKVEP